MTYPEPHGGSVAETGTIQGSCAQSTRPQWLQGSCSHQPNPCPVQRGIFFYQTIMLGNISPPLQRDVQGERHLSRDAVVSSNLSGSLLGWPIAQNFSSICRIFLSRSGPAWRRAVQGHECSKHFSEHPSWMVSLCGTCIMLCFFYWWVVSDIAWMGLIA